MGGLSLGRPFLFVATYHVGVVCVGFNTYCVFQSNLPYLLKVI